MGMVTLLLLVCGCLSVLLVIAAVVLVIWFQNRQAAADSGGGQPVNSATLPPLPADVIDQLKTQLAAGQKIEAIKIYRQATGAPLAEAKAAVEAIASGRPVLAQSPLPQATDLEAQIRQLLADDQKLNAIKRYREATGADLKTAKDAVEAIERGQPLPQPLVNALPPVGEDTQAQVRSLLQQGLKINAIKVYREATGATLAEAKSAVEAIERDIAGATADSV